ncbi:MAG: NAD-dependent epimerase/dehydratase family protein [Planctomycetia bacterium]|nr:NAD-dependent epimerase/dehydratase family protein [Planctomycetia bacterium]
MAEKMVFVTGATGFIGTTVVEKLLARGYRVRGMGRRETPVLPQGGITTMEKTFGHPNFEYCRGDVTDAKTLSDGIRGCQYVIHLAAYANNWARKRETFDQINMGGTQNVLQAIRDHGVEKAVLTSTIMTLGVTPPGKICDETLERTDGVYFTDYERTKRAAEQEIFRQVRTYGVPVVVVNPTRVFGPGQLSESNSVVKIMDMYERGIFPFLPNFGKNLGNYVLVDDVAEGEILALEKGRVGERYILGGDENITLRQLFEYVDEFRGRRGFKLPLWKFWPMVVGHSLNLFANCTGIYPAITPGWVKTFIHDAAFTPAKAERELGYRPTPLRESLKKAYDWMHSIEMK